MRHDLRTNRFIAPVLATRRRFAGVTVLLVVTVFGATIQAGALAPNFHGEGSSDDSGTLYTGTLENVSWRSWTVSDPRFIGGRREEPFERSRTLDARLYRSDPSDVWNNGSGPAVRHLVLRPGQSLMLGVEVGGGCPSEVRAVPGGGLTTTSPQPRHAVTVEASVATPLGSRIIRQTFEVSCLR